MFSEHSSGGSRWDRKKEETKKRIIDVAMGLFKSQGVDRTSMEQIAEEADVARGTLYNYFPVKEAIISEFVQRTVREKNSEGKQLLLLIPDTRSRLLALFQEALKWALQHRDIMEKYTLFRLQNFHISVTDKSLGSGFEMALTGVIKAGQELGEIRSDLPHEIMARHLRVLYLSLIMEALVKNENFDMQHKITETVDLFLDGAKGR